MTHFDWFPSAAICAIAPVITRSSHHVALGSFVLTSLATIELCAFSYRSSRFSSLAWTYGLSCPGLTDNVQSSVQSSVARLLEPIEVGTSAVCSSHATVVSIGMGVVASFLPSIISSTISISCSTNSRHFSRSYFPFTNHFHHITNHFLIHIPIHLHFHLPISCFQFPFILIIHLHFHIIHHQFHFIKFVIHHRVIATNLASCLLMEK